MIKNNQIRVLMVETGGKGGMYAYAEALSEGLCENGVDTCVLTSSNWPDSKRDFRVERLMVSVNAKNNKSKLLWAFDRCWRVIYNSLKRNYFAVHNNFDVVHIQTGTPIIDQYLLKPLVRRLPVVLTVHDVKQHMDILKTKALFTKRYFHLPDRLIVHYEDGKRQLVDDWKVPSSRVDVIPHGAMSLECEMDSHQSRKDLSLSLDSKIILFFGGIRDNKGLDVLISAMKDVIAVCPDALLVIAGGMPRGLSFERYDKLIGELKLSGYVQKFIRFIEEKDVNRFFAAADIVAVPYLHFEAQSGILLRAYTHKKPVVVSNIGAMGEIVNEDKIGLAVEPAKPGELACALVRVLNDLDGFKSKYTPEIENKYSWKKIGALTVNSYEKAIKNRIV